MNNDAVRVNRIDFRETMPSLRLLEALGLAFSVQCLVPALLGVLAASAIDAAMPQKALNEDSILDISSMAQQLQMPVRDFRELVILGFSNGFRPFIRLPLMLLVVGFTGVAISRSAGLHFCADRRSGVFRSLRHVARFWQPLLISILLLCMLLTIAVCGFWTVLKLTQWIFGTGSLCTASGTPIWLTSLIFIIGGSCVAMGWLLSLAAIGIDSCDGPESLSRGISYVLSRFQRVVCYSAILMLMLAISSAAVSQLIIHSGNLATQASLSVVDPAADCGSGFASFMTIAAQTWIVSLTFCGVTIIYVLLRSIEDGVSLHDVDTGKPVSS